MGVSARLQRAARLRAARLIHGPDRLAVPRELWREALFFAAGRFRDTVEVRWPSGSYVVATHDYDVSRRTYVSGPYGLARLLRAGELVTVRGREVLEIGANIGTTTVPLITLLGAARVHAFEPVQRNFELLERNAVKNGLAPHVDAHKEAVSNEVGSVSLTVPARFWGSSRIADAGQPAPATTIDALIADGTIDPAKLALVWIDVEGHEAAVLAGARTLPAVPIVLEHDPAQQADLARLHAEIARRAGRLVDLATGADASLERLGTTDVLILP